LIFDWSEFLARRFLGNSYERWGTALLILLSGYLLAALVRSFVKNRLRKIAPLTKGRADDLLLLLVERTTHPFLFVVFLYFAIRTLRLDPDVLSVINHIAVFIGFLQLGRWAVAALQFFSVPYTTIKTDQDASRATTMRALFFLGSIVIWAGVVLLILDNWGIKISALVAGLGVVGVAGALAVQNVLGDLFASLSIVFDKPFVLGDFIIVDKDMGTVENIGLKTTRVRSLTGEQLIFSNSDLLRSRIRNTKRQQERRVQLGFGVAYETAPAKLERVVDIIKQSLNGVEKVRFERAHLAGFGDSALNYELVYWVIEPDFNLHMDIQQAFMLKVIRALEAEGIEFAYPTRKVFLEGTLREPKPANLDAERNLAEPRP
jgi:small-conductance mechanosensitive channel